MDPTRRGRPRWVIRGKVDLNAIAIAFEGRIDGSINIPMVGRHTVYWPAPSKRTCIPAQPVQGAAEPQDEK